MTANMNETSRHTPNQIPTDTNNSNLSAQDAANASTAAEGTSASAPRFASPLTAVVTIMKLELLGRVRSKKWIAALIAWIVVLTATWVGTTAYAAQTLDFTVSQNYQTLLWVYCMIVYFTLAVSLVIAPALSSTSINGDRETANLAILQVTPITAGQLLGGKLLAAWISGLVFVLAAAIPLSIMVALHGLGWRMLLGSLTIIMLEIFATCALGLGFSAVITRPVISVLITYLVLGALSIGGPMAYAFTYPAVAENVKYPTMTLDSDRGSEKVPYFAYTQSDGNETWTRYCHKTTRSDVIFHTERTWFFLIASPFTILPDATTGLQSGNKALKEKNQEKSYLAANDSLFSTISYNLARIRQPQPNAAQRRRQIQAVPPPYLSVWDECYVDKNRQVHETYEDSTLNKLLDKINGSPSDALRYMGHGWYWGLGLHVILAFGAVLAAWRRLRTPVRHLPSGVRIA